MRPATTTSCRREMLLFLPMDLSRREHDSGFPGLLDLRFHRNYSFVLAFWWWCVKCEVEDGVKIKIVSVFGEKERAHIRGVYDNFSSQSSNKALLLVMQTSAYSYIQQEREKPCIIAGPTPKQMQSLAMVRIKHSRSNAMLKS